MTKMKISKLLCCTAAVGLAACLAQNATAQNTAWIGAISGDGLWSDAANWTAGIPNSVTPWVNIDPGTGVGPCTIPPGYAADAGSAVAGALYGPEWGQTLNIYGSLALGWMIAPVQNWPNYGLHCSINMYNGSSMTTSGAALCLGDNWW